MTVMSTTCEKNSLQPSAVLGGWGEGGEREKKERNVDLKALPLVSLSLKLEGVSE